MKTISATRPPPKHSVSEAEAVNAYKLLLRYHEERFKTAVLDMIADEHEQWIKFIKAELATIAEFEK